MLKNENAAGKNNVRENMVKGGGDVIWIWKMCNRAFESGGVSEDLRSDAIVHCTRVKKI